MHTLADNRIPPVASVRAELISAVLSLISSPTSDSYERHAVAVLDAARTFVEVSDAARTLANRVMIGDAYVGLPQAAS